MSVWRSPDRGPHPLHEESARESAMRIDCMLGHSSMNVDGITRAGLALPVMRRGEFVEF
jgi:leucyl aminopeptidase (aminopeptidase T)